MSSTVFLGIENSGKTVLMSMLCRYLDSLDASLSLNPTNHAAFQFMEIVPALLAAGLWPKQTTVDSVFSFQWELQFQGETISEVEMLDYPGEAVRTLFTGSTEEERLRCAPIWLALSKRISHANQIFLLFDISLIKRAPVSPRTLDAIWQTCETVNFLRTLPNAPRPVIVLTQADRCCDNIEHLDAKQLLLEAHPLFAKRGFEELPIIAVSAIGKTFINDQGQEVPDVNGGGPINFLSLVKLLLEDTALGENYELCEQTLQSLVEDIRTTEKLLDAEAILERVEPISLKFNNLRHLFESIHFLFEPHRQAAMRAFLEKQGTVLQSLTTIAAELAEKVPPPPPQPDFTPPPSAGQSYNGFQAFYTKIKKSVKKWIYAIAGLVVLLIVVGSCSNYSRNTNIQEAFITLCKENGIDMDKYDIVDWELEPRKNGYYKGTVTIRTPEGDEKTGSFTASDRENDHSVYIKWTHLPTPMYKDFLANLFHKICEDNDIPLNGYEIVSMELTNTKEGKVASFIVKTPTGEREEGTFNVYESNGDVRIGFLPTQLPPSLLTKFASPANE